jgi:putative IMPACT (imprinted ancient) family translation regulator
MYHQSRADGEESNFVFGAAEWIREHIVEVAPQSSIATNGTETSGRHGNELVCPEIVHGEPFVDRKSRFVAHVAHISHPDQVQLVIAELYKDKKVATATHNIVAYRVDVSGGSGDGGPTSVCEHRDDDGESGAGEPMLHMMKNINAINLVVVVTRWFGGIELGPDRFKIITNVAKQLLLQVMEADKQLTDEEEARRRNTKMRPMTEVIARLKYDPGYSERLSSIVVGVLDGTDKIKPISFSEMEGYSTDSSLLNLVQVRANTW